jgi:NAD-dependent deacetylase
LPDQALRLAYEAAQRSQVFLSVGTSAVVQPAASLPLIARRAGAYLIEINVEETSLSVFADCWLQDKAGAVLPALVRRVIGDIQSREEGA